MRNIQNLTRIINRNIMMIGIKRTKELHTNMALQQTKGKVVMVTGGSGFLGQHIISLLQTKLPAVTEIRVYDLKPYKNMLGHEATKPVTSIVGCITDEYSLSQALHGVDSVYHVAGKISYGTFPDYKAMKTINVDGTSTLIHSCLQCDVRRLLYCSTVDVVIGHDDIINGNEDNTSLPSKFLFPGYPESKYNAEKLVLQANSMQTKKGNMLHTVSLRANVMYGELDPYYVTNGLKNAHKHGGILYQVGDGRALFQPVYVGNTAWAFICADKAMECNPDIGGQVYFIPDDTPIQNTFKFMRPFLEIQGFQLSSIQVPYKLVYYTLLLAEKIVNLLSPLIKIDLPAESYSVKYINMNLYFSNRKAKEYLKFEPMFKPKDSIQRCMQYYKNIKF